LPDQAVEKAYEKWWPELEAILTDAVDEAGKTLDARSEPTRSQGEILEEILELTRSISRHVAKTTESGSVDDNLKKYILCSRLKDIPKDINYYTWNELKDMTLDDIKWLKGKEIKAGEIWDERLREALLEKTKGKKTEDDESDN
jgi:hypothetical protein